MVDEPGQFHVVPIPATFDVELRFRARIAARYAVVDVQLSGDALANDEGFIHEYGDRIGPGHYRHRTLVDKLGADGIARVRRFVADLLFALTREGDRFVWILDGGLRSDLDDEHSDDRLLLSACVDEARLDGSLAPSINGSFVFLGGERSELAFEAQRLGHHDRVRGIAGPGLALGAVLTKLTLASPVPTSSVRLQAGLDNLAALEAVLPVVGLFFEELDNGTRLRLVSGTLSGEQMAEAVTTVREAMLGHR